MNMKNLIFCHWDIVRFLSEDTLNSKDEGKTICVSDSNNFALMIFLGKADNLGYQVKIIKTENNSSYVPNEYDNIDLYEENDEEANFFFSKFEAAREFTDRIGYVHPEYRERCYTPYEEVIKRYTSECK